VTAPPRAPSGKDEQFVTSDVYAGDIATIRSAVDTRSTIYWFRVKADTEPDVLARVASIFNIANAAPRQATFLRDSPDVANMSVAIELSRAAMAEMIRRKLEQLTCVISVELMVATGSRSIP
jgi:(p)ppGpp synthase/HD superfamily hydrolase